MQTLPANKCPNISPELGSSRERILVSIKTHSKPTTAYRNRQVNHASIQKEWVKQQKREHEWNASNEAKEESEWAAQTESITRMRGMLEDEATMKKK